MTTLLHRALAAPCWITCGSPPSDLWDDIRAASVLTGTA